MRLISTNDDNMRYDFLILAACFDRVIHALSLEPPYVDLEDAAKEALRIHIIRTLESKRDSYKEQGLKIVYNRDMLAKMLAQMTTLHPQRGDDNSTP
jgi:hypothetical protein